MALIFHLVFATSLLFSFSLHEDVRLLGENAAIKNEQVESDPDVQPLELEVTLIRKYVNGEVSEEVINETILSMEDFWAKYAEWNLVEMDEGKIVFEQKIDDISPLIKMNGYFGITDDGTLTIFNGKPDDAHIIQSFFQIDVKKLEGRKHKQLQKGIPVKSKEDYKEILETLKHYSVSIQETFK